MKAAIERKKPGAKNKPPEDKVLQVAFYLPKKAFLKIKPKEMKKISIKAIAEELDKKGFTLQHKLLK